MTIVLACESTSTKMNASTPTENMARATRRAAAHQLQTPNGEPDVDGEAGEGSEGDGLGEGHGKRSTYKELGHPKGPTSAA